MRYLDEQPGVWSAGGLPAGLTCLGTEPFWSVSPEGSTLRVTRLGEEDAVLPVTAVDDTDPGGRRVTAGEGAQAMQLAVSPAVCSDGMSDRVFCARRQPRPSHGATAGLLLGAAASLIAAFPLLDKPPVLRQDGLTGA